MEYNLSNSHSEQYHYRVQCYTPKPEVQARVAAMGAMMGLGWRGRPAPRGAAPPNGQGLAPRARKSYLPPAKGAGAGAGAGGGGLLPARRAAAPRCAQRLVLGGTPWQSRHSPGPGGTSSAAGMQCRNPRSRVSVGTASA